MIELQNVSVSFPVFHGDQDASLRSFLSRQIGNLSKVKTQNKQIVVEGLKNINLTIATGDRLGLVGRNGSGKSTLLKTIAGIYPISSGSISRSAPIRGFFNIGAGLDFSVSGYRNIRNLAYFYTQNREEIEDKVPSIIEFSELAEFIYMPVSTYSSGMIARLMVSVAVAFDAENILFDEVIGAGDERFLNKLNLRIGELIRDTKCFVLATHSVGLMKQYCNRAIWIDKGEIKLEGTVDEVIKAYQA
ncbi:ABC transporter ATP-binding protein [Methylococcus sp. EFPC2]|uniref:ABC transporter ATP-binding protein n=1 Tax=Methylococcus sp. EFPC2 TaxID=2812648 RepID=UPI001F072FFF|nr:ATP-binding cassette domain-containing protein [Methylococcus sp. EFPC2]